MIDVKQACKTVIEKRPGFVPDSIMELDDFYTISLKPEGSPYGIATGLICYAVNKSTGELSIKAGEDYISVFTNTKFKKRINPETFEYE